MKTSWTQGVEKERQIDIRQNFKEALVMRQRLIEMLESKMETSQRQSRSEVLYDNPNWALLQADKRGYERALQDVIELIFEKPVYKR
ncbi:hypothetical protein D3C85_167170 [compost metagenome]